MEMDIIGMIAAREYIILTVRLLVSCSGSWTSKLLGLVSSWISDQQGTIKLDKDVLDLLLALLVNKLLIVGHQRLGQCLSDGIDLRHVPASLHTDADVDVGKSVLAKEKNRFHELELKSFGLNLLEGTSINLDQTLSSLAISNSGGSLLASEDLDRLYGFLLISHPCFSCRSESSNISL